MFLQGRHRIVGAGVERLAVGEHPQALGLDGQLLALEVRQRGLEHGEPRLRSLDVGPVLRRTTDGRLPLDVRAAVGATDFRHGAARQRLLRRGVGLPLERVVGPADPQLGLQPGQLGAAQEERGPEAAVADGAADPLGRLGGIAVQTLRGADLAAAGGCREAALEPTAERRVTVGA